ncbi:hypothetical protein BDV97DRAFT_396752 [Delphinella strobiligena]|nr:hypothetical protein BDV97DRAFT_396752 [Delphinella strobiligena]
MSRANNGGGVQKIRKAKKADPKHSLTQGKLRSAQGHQLKVLERLLGSIGWKGRHVNSGSNGRSSGLVHNKFDILEGGISQVSFLDYLAPILLKPEEIARLLSNLELWEPEECSGDNDVSREQVCQPLGFKRSSSQDECLRQDIILDMMKPEFRPLVERHFAEYQKNVSSIFEGLFFDHQSNPPLSAG